MSSDNETLSSGGFAPFELFFKEELICKAAKEGILDPKLHQLPALATLWDGREESNFAKVLFGFSELGLYFQIFVDTPKIAVSYPEIEKADAIELFIDTRGVSQAKTTHRFCHHFFFLPEAFEGIQKGEITRFRTEDSHPLADSDELHCEISKTKKGYSAALFLPAEVLVGYAPHECNRIGFTYRISRSDGKQQFFSLSNSGAKIEYAPYLWTILRLVE